MSSTPNCIFQGPSKSCQLTRLQPGRGEVHFLHGKQTHAFSVKGLYASLLWQPRDSVSSEMLPKEQRQRTFEPQSRCRPDQGLLLAWEHPLHSASFGYTRVEEGCGILLRDHFSGPRSVSASRVALHLIPVSCVSCIRQTPCLNPWVRYVPSRESWLLGTVGWHLG